jgi:cobalt-zinc-cadmium efflux system outer membrane protein
MNPEVGFDREAPGEANQSFLWLRWQPPLDGRRGLRKEAAEAGVQAAESEFEWAKLQLRVRLRGVYAEWAYVAERRDLLLGHLTVIKQLADRARARADTGEESGVVARRLALAAAEVQSELGQAEAALARVEAKVRVVHPELQAGVRPIRPELPAVPSEPDWSDRPDVEARRFEVQEAELRKRLSGRFLEFPELMVGWTRVELTPGTLDGPIFGLSWNVPFFDRNQGERAQATQNVAIAEAGLELANMRAKVELEATHGAYEQLRSAAVEVTAATANADGLVESVTAAFQVGENTLTDLLETLRSVLGSQMAALNLHHNALEAHRNLEAAAGGSLSSGGTE